MRLRLVQLPCAPASGIYPTYQLAAAVQELVRRAFLRAKSGAQPAGASVPVPVPPQPTVIAFTPRPTYTLGRRQHLETLGAAAMARLQAPLEVATTTTTSFSFHPAVLPSLRGGLTTYHGPGQVVLWPVFDLKAPQLAQAWTVRAYSRLLETTTAAVLGRQFGVAAHTTADPGLWVGGSGAGDGREERKIAALGVHLRRNIAALGVAVNLSMPVMHGNEDAGMDDATTNPWRRFVPCGLTGKGVTCVAAEVGKAGGTEVDLAPTAFAASWAATLAEKLGLGLEDAAATAAGGSIIDHADRPAVQQLVEQGCAMLGGTPALLAEEVDGPPRGLTEDDKRYVTWVTEAPNP